MRELYGGTDDISVTGPPLAVAESTVPCHRHCHMASVTDASRGARVAGIDSGQRRRPAARRSACDCARIARLDHHAQHRLGARRRGSARGRSSPSSRSTLGLRVGQRARCAFQSPPGARRTLISVCGNSVTPCEQLGQRLRPLRRTACSTCSALTMPSPVVCLSSASRWPEPSPPSSQPRATQLFEHVAVADLGAHERRRRARAAPARPPCWSSACRPRPAPPGPAPGGRAPSRRAARRRCRGGRCASTTAAGRRRRRARCRSRRRARARPRPAPAARWRRQPSLMLKPSGVQPIATTSAPSSWNTSGATW